MPSVSEDRENRSAEDVRAAWMSENSGAASNPDPYAIGVWGDGFLAVGERGTIQVRPDRDPARQIDLRELVSGLRDRGDGTPVLLHVRDPLEPTRQGTFVDLTCDSDGKVERSIDLDGVPGWLPLHELVDGERHTLTAFLVGGYQETFGERHNLFGDTHVTHIRIDWGATVDRCARGR